MSTEPKFTPGPWNLVWWGNEQWPYPLSILADNDGVWIARDGTVSSEANARLIAAAPDLFHALKSLLDDCEEYSRINKLHNEDGSPATNHSMRWARATLSKANPAHTGADFDGALSPSAFAAALVEAVAASERSA